MAARYAKDLLAEIVKRGLVGVQLAISDAHAGLKAAIAKVLGCAWQRCTVQFLRDCLGRARKDQHGLLAALIRPIFNAENLEQGAIGSPRSGRSRHGSVSRGSLRRAVRARRRGRRSGGSGDAEVT